ncbi:MAG: hypothetical protein ACI8RZ_004470 [Myxococcota bacterium]|jgi:hypothetical protein
MSGMVSVIQLGAFLLSVVTGWLVLQQRQRRVSLELIAPTWRRLAEAHGWRFIDGTFGISSRLEGRRDGYDFTATAQIEDGRIVLTVPLHSPSPDDEAFHATLSSFAEADFLPALSDAVASARQVDGGSAEAWSALAELHGLTLSTRRGERTLRGEIDGHPIRIGTHPDPVETILRVKIGTPWPDGVLIQPREVGGAASMTTGNPILDALVTVTASDAPGIRTALCDPTMAEDLLAVLHPYPRSSVVGGHVQMHCPGRLEEALPERLADVMALARRLRGA